MSPTAFSFLLSHNNSTTVVAKPFKDKLRVFPAAFFFSTIKLSIVNSQLLITPTFDATLPTAPVVTLG